MIKLYYKEYELGTLTFDNATSEYVYNSNINNEISAKSKYPIAMEFYYLNNSVNKKQKTLFDDFLNFTSCLERADIVQNAKIANSDTLYKKLEKLANLSLLNNDFYIKQ